MPTYVALLRAVNVGGTGKLPMSELKAMCVAWAAPGSGFPRLPTVLCATLIR